MTHTHPHLICIAPMMDYTDRHDRYFLRLIAPHARLYTEMITTAAIQHGDRDYLLGFDPAEQPLALQVGGNDPKKLSECAKIAQDFGYDEINLNVGCPSDRVRSGLFGACLMLNPSLVAECVHAMQANVKIPVTVKCRIGVDHQDSYAALSAFIATVKSGGCHTFIIHARKAWLSGLSPKQNREIPPLCYDVVKQIKKDFKTLSIIINGGIKSTVVIQALLQDVDGVMIGREAYANPFWLAEVENKIWNNECGKPFPLTRHEIIEKLLPYIHAALDNKIKLSAIARHILGLFQGQPGAKIWRRHLSQHMHQNGAGAEVILQALKLMQEQC